MKPVEREALESAARLLEALRIESSVSRILGDWEKEVYEAIDRQVNEALEGQGPTCQSIQQTLDAAAADIAQMDKLRASWAVYLMEAIDADLEESDHGDNAGRQRAFLESVQEAIEIRLDSGGW
jgi:hypothetical protein